MSGPPKRWLGDKVALTGAVLALVGCFALPLAVLRSSRLAVGGVPFGMLAAGPWGVACAALAVAALAVAFVRPLGTRRTLALLDAAALAVALAFALGEAARHLLASAPRIARVSPGEGFWVALAACAAIALTGRAGGAAVDSRGRASRWLAPALAAAVAAGWAAAVRFGGLGLVAIAREYDARPVVFRQLLVQHAELALAGLVGGIVLGVPLGIAASRSRRFRDVALGVTGILETIPSLALLGLLIAPLAALAAAYPALEAAGVSGIGTAPAVVALTIYALLPIVRGTYVALTSVDPALIDAARGMGMSPAQRFARVQLPLAFPLVIEGVRVAAVLLIGITTVTAFIGAGGLGALIVQGIGQNAPDLILLGALPVIVLAVVADYGLRGAAAAATPKGVRAS